MHARIMKVVAGATIILVAATTAQANERWPGGGHNGRWFDGTYLEFRAGANFLDAADNSAGGSGAFLGETDFDTGFTAGVALGYSFANRGIFGTALSD